MIELKNISKTFRSSKKKTTALKNVSLKIQQGKIFGIIGKSGAGKSTLIRCINLLEKPDEGEIWVDNVNLMKLSDSKLALERRKIGMIFQHFNLLSSRTVEDNIALPLELIGISKTEMKKRVDELLHLVGINDKAKEYPANLSGGQKQRVAIARALASNPSLLLCDEATSALDPATTKSILSLLKEINQKLNLTILLITHEMDVINSICDEVGVINNAVLVEHGTVEDIFTNPKENITKEFISNSLDLSLPPFFQKNITDIPTQGSATVYKLIFTNLTNYNSLIEEAKKDTQTDIEIINSRIEYAGPINYGSFFIKVFTNKTNIENLENYLKRKHFNIKKIGYVGSDN